MQEVGKRAADENEAPAVEFTTTYLTKLSKKLEPQLKVLSARGNAVMEQSFVRSLSRETAGHDFSKKSAQLTSCLQRPGCLPTQRRSCASLRAPCAQRPLCVSATSNPTCVTQL